MSPQRPVFLAFVVFLSSCASFEAPAAHAGFNRREIHALVETYYWKAEYPAPSYSDQQLSDRLSASADPTLDGERAESQASAVAIALCAVGDDRFAAALSKQPEAVQRAVFRWISYFWTHYGLHYPKTQQLLHKYA